MRFLIGTVLCLGATLLAVSRNAARASDPLTATLSNYQLGCGGCHGFDGVSNSKLVPTLKGLVGFYLNTADGRDYLPRLPNVAFSTMSDQELAAVLNYAVFEIGGSSAPIGARPYDASEVGRLRKRPLTEVPLHLYRREIVDALIADFHASEALRIYQIGIY